MEAAIAFLGELSAIILLPVLLIIAVLALICLFSLGAVIGKAMEEVNHDRRRKGGIG